MISNRVALLAGDIWAARLIRSTARVAFAAWDLLFISAVMQAGLALPMAYYFHRATTIGLPANLIVVPLTQVMMPSAVVALALGYVSAWLAKLLSCSRPSRSMESQGRSEAWADCIWRIYGSQCRPPS